MLNRPLVYGLVLCMAVTCVVFFAIEALRPPNANPTPTESERPRRLESILFKMSHDELFDAGVTAVDNEHWSIAWSTDSPEDRNAIASALAKCDLAAYGSFGRGRAGWYIHRKDFFAAQSALKRSEDVKNLGIEIVEPKIPIRESK